MSEDKYMKEVIAPGDQASQMAYDICRVSSNYSSAIRVSSYNDDFRGLVTFNFRDEALKRMLTGEVELILQNDGAGGKPQFFTLIGDEETFYGLGWEIITMCADDVARYGGLAVAIANQIDTKSINKDNIYLLKALMCGYGDALNQSRLANITGEIAVMRHSITSFCDNGYPYLLNLTWGGTCLGLIHKKRIFSYLNVEPGMPIVGFHERGYRCNGGTLFTELILRMGNNNIEKILTDRRIRKFVKKLTVPSISYARLMSTANGWGANGINTGPLMAIASAAHITGGGIWKKLKNILPFGVGIKLDNMPKPPAVLLEAQKISWNYEDLKLSDYRAHSTFHGGCGMMTICKKDRDANKLIKLAKAHGIRATIVGKTVRSIKSEIRIKSRFLEGKKLSSENPE